MAVALSDTDDLRTFKLVCIRRYGDDLAVDVLAGVKSPASLLSPVNRSPHRSPCPPIFKPSPRSNAGGGSLSNTPGAMLDRPTNYQSPPVFRHAGNLPVPGPPVGGVPAGFGGAQVCPSPEITSGAVT